MQKWTKRLHSCESEDYSECPKTVGPIFYTLKNNGSFIGIWLHKEL